MTKLITACITAVIVIPILIAAGLHQALSSMLSSQTQPSHEALTDIPHNYLVLYQRATAVCPQLGWNILAAIGKIETDHGRSPLPGVHSGENFAGAGGPMQFLQSTWDSVIEKHEIPFGGSNPASRYNPHDAIHAAAYYLCDSGADQGDLYSAIFAYNHADWYVNKVLTQAARYIQQPDKGSMTCSSFPEPLHTSSNQALIAVNFACLQLGKPYVWGGNGSPGFDCSGLTHAAYAEAGISIPRTAHTQYLAGPLVPTTSPQPGDLLFFGTPHKVHHVAISLGGTMMIHAPTFGEPVQIGDYRKHKDFLAVSRPINSF